MVVLISVEEVVYWVVFDVEFIVWVDEQDCLFGSLLCVELCECGLIGCGIFILLFNFVGELCVQCWILSKVVYFGYWDFVVGGMVQVGEFYVDFVVCELEEELGICDVVLCEYGCFFFDELGNWFWCVVFFVVFDVFLCLQVEEIFEVCFICFELVLEEVCSLLYCFDFLQVLCLYLDV